MYINFRLALTFRWTFGQMRHMKGSATNKNREPAASQNLGGPGTSKRLKIGPDGPKYPTLSKEVSHSSRWMLPPPSSSKARHNFLGMRRRCIQVWSFLFQRFIPGGSHKWAGCGKKTHGKEDKIYTLLSATSHNRTILWLVDVGSKTHGNLGKSHKPPACAKCKKNLGCVTGHMPRRFRGSLPKVRLAQSINSKIENSTSAQKVSKVKNLGLK